MVNNCLVVTIFLASYLSITVSLHCFTCANIADSEDCRNVTQCQSGQKCYGEHKLYGDDTLLTLGCIDRQHCPDHHQFSMVGRSTNSPCTECCLGDGCNRELCSIQHISAVHNPRVCTDDHNTNCTQLAILIDICSDVPHAKNVCRKHCGLCPLVDGDWAEWGGWSFCSTTCGLGVKSRSRSCSNPVPQHGGDQCTGNGTQVHSCYDRECPVHGEWNSWSPWETCSATCDGRGISKRHRTCTNPAPSLYGHNCIGDPVDFKICHGHPCTTALPNGTTHVVDCEDVLDDCFAANASTVICSDFKYARQMCPEFCGLCSVVDGQWAGWLSWGGCSTTCDNGTWTRARTCTNPPPAKGGKQCQGSGKELAVCNLGSCPVHGGWADWAHWTTCSSSCGQGITRRLRGCTKPRPSLQGNNCFGDSTEYGMCFTKSCQVSGGWGDWSLWSSCSVSCGSGQNTRQRSCTSPRPANGGQTCVGTRLENKQCHPGACPINGGWSAWTSWTACSRSCNGGERTRSRSCSNPSPSRQGRQCVGNSNEVSVCNGHRCPGVTVACSSHSTTWNDHGNGGVGYLDRHDVSCGYHQYLKRMHLEYDGSRIRYVYTCCTVT